MTKITGQYSTNGDYNEYARPVDVHRFGDSLRDEDGFIVGILDEYGEWVSPTMHRLGLRSRLQVEA